MRANGMRPADYELFARFGIDPALLDAAAVRRVTHHEARDELGIRWRSDHLEGIAFTYADPTSGDPWTYRVRRDHPEIEDNKPRAKYLEPPDRHRLYFVPGSAPLLTDTTATVVLVEAEKSALTMTAAARRLHRAVLPIALGGCWGWKGTIGKTIDANGVRVDEKGPLPDLDRITWTDRDVVILFDANTTNNGTVHAARKQLAGELAKRGAVVRLGTVPTEDGINGPDDYRAAHTDAALFALLDTAKPINATTKKTKAEKPGQGRELKLETPELWPDPVDGPTLVAGLQEMFATYIALPAHAALALALWVLHAYTIDASFVSPILAITSPVMRCGKTTLLIVVGALTPRRVYASNITAAGLFRLVEKFAPTLLVDEADTFFRDDDDLRGILNSGFLRTAAMTIRPVGDDHEPRAFSTWCAKVVALIGRLPPTLTDRAIEIAMRRRLPNESVERLRLDTIDAEAETLRRQAARWAADHLEQVRVADPDVPKALHDRAADCWRPLLAIADAIGGAIVVADEQTGVSPARTAALALSGAQTIAESDLPIELLKDIRVVLRELREQTTTDGAIKTDVLLEHLHAMADRPWPAFGRNEKPITSHKLAQFLKRFGIVAAGRCYFADGSRVRGYRLDAFTEAFDRYLGPEAPADQEAF